jgi:DNA anti-recombination protein RmuC
MLTKIIQIVQFFWNFLKKHQLFTQYLTIWEKLSSKHKKFQKFIDFCQNFTQKSRAVERGGEPVIFTGAQD